MSRFEKLFASLEEKNEGAFVPFVMLGDPNAEDAIEIISAVIEGGADALELGVPFSDPVADGPTIQNAHHRALVSGATVASSLDQIREIRSRYPDIPISMLMYSNVAYVRGYDHFYHEFHEAGADAILLPDVPVRESAPFVEAATANGIEPVFIAPAKANPEVLEGVAKHSRGYIYGASRDGVTGTELESQTLGLADVVNNVAAYGGAPILLGFGISEPHHVSDAIDAGAAGAITGSAIAKIIDEWVGGDSNEPVHITDMDALKDELKTYVAGMKQATIKA